MAYTPPTILLPFCCYPAGSISAQHGLTAVQHETVSAAQIQRTVALFDPVWACSSSPGASASLDTSAIVLTQLGAS